LQNEITSRIAVALNLELTNREAARSTEQPDALDYLLRGRAAFWDWQGARSRDRLAETTRLFERALALDPRSGEAKSWVAFMLFLREEPTAADLQRADELVVQALEASPRDGFAHQVKGLLLLRVQGRCDEAIPEFETALALNPNWLGSLNQLALCKIMTGSIEDGIRLEEQAIRLSPRDPLIRLFYTNMGIAHLLQYRRIRRHQVLSGGAPGSARECLRYRRHGQQGPSTDNREPQQTPRPRRRRRSNASRKSGK